jgi:hypothetical protein
MYDTLLDFSYLVARCLSPRDLASLVLCCVDWYDMCATTSTFPGAP